MRTETSSEQPFALLKALQQELWAWLVRAGEPGDCGAEAALFGVAERFVALTEKHADAALGALLIDAEPPYVQVHPLMVAIICELVARRVGVGVAVRRSICAAALSCNVGMLELQEALSKQTAPLDAAQKALRNAHPTRSHELLRAAGVRDPRWLEIVLQHHEKPDGSGYPRGLRAAEIGLPARLVSLADIYTAMVLPRNYRDGLHAQQAVREIFLHRGTLVDSDLAAQFINELGVFPPGIFVRLANGETGVVIKRGAPKASCPTVSCFISPRGSSYDRPVLRDTAELDLLAVSDVLPRQAVPFSLPAIWGHAH